MLNTAVQIEPRRGLSPAQELIWTSQRLHPEVPLANMAILTTIEGPVDPERFINAVDQVVLGSDVLRMTVVEVDGIPHPGVMSDAPSQTRCIELPLNELESWMDDQIAVPLDTATAVYDSVLISHGPASWSWWMNIHHIATDAGSSAQIFRAVSEAYEGQWQPGMSYQDFTKLVVTQQQTPRWQRAVEYWKTLDQPTEPTGLYKPDAGPTTRAERVRVEMAGTRTQRMQELLADRFQLLTPDMSLTVALATALATYLWRLNGSDRVVIGLPVHNRSTREAKTVIGPLVELFPLVVDVEAGDTFATLQSRVARTLMTVLRHAHPGTSPRQNFDVVLNVHAATFGNFGEMQTTHRWIHPGHIDSHHRLRLQALDYDGSGTLELALDINHAVADTEHRNRAAAHFGQVIDALVADVDRKLCDVVLQTPEESRLLAGFNQGGRGTPLEAPAPDLISRCLHGSGSATVMSHGKHDMSGLAVDALIDRTARALGRAGVGRGDLVAIEIPISTDAVIAIHAVLRCGAAFLPIDPSYPQARRDFLRSDSGAKVTIRSLSEVDDLRPIGPPVDAGPIHLDDLAYVLYTSGSTGLPKGVPISHRGLSEYLGFALNAYIDDSPPVMPLYTSLSFDLTITTLFVPWLASGLLTIHPDGGVAALREIVDEQRATVMKATPSHLELLIRMIGPSHRLRTLIVGGEAFMCTLADQLIQTLGPELSIFNEYGPTEAVVGCMIHRYDPSVDPGPEVPIGSPAPGVTLAVLDTFGHPLPIGAVGELFITRPGMATGYLDRPELTEKSFIPSSEDPGAKLYRTGDRVRMLDANTMVYLGRLDNQMKVGGIRIEPGDIEAAALAVPGVNRAVAALWRPDTSRRAELCVRCGLGSDVPNITIDGDGVCSACHEFDVVAPQAQVWFRTEEDLRSELATARERSTGLYDVLHLLSGGKDSTYALYRLISMGARVYALTLDNGYISEGAKDNVRRAAQALGVDHEFVTVEGMDEIFRDSLERFSNVCNGCYKTIYTVALERADQLGIPAIVTGLSRGQFFETRLVPGLFGAERFDPEAIDAAVDQARRVYHNTHDAVADHLDTEFLKDGRVLDQVTFIDFYRYVDVELSEMYEALERSGTWRRPEDTGRSTNCLINAAGIYVHKIEQAHHNYALPYSWDVRLGHKTREEALFELDDPMNAEELQSIKSMLSEVGYEPRPMELLTLWIEADDSVDVADVRTSLAQSLPGHAQPQAIERVESFPLTTNGKIEMSALPSPTLRRTWSSNEPGRAPESPTELRVAATWERVLGLAQIGATDDFFAMGGTSLHALEMIVRVSDICDVKVPESLAFLHTTVEDLAAAIDRLPPTTSGDGDGNTEGDDDPIDDASGLGDSDPLALTPWEEAFLFEHLNDPDSAQNNVGRRYTVEGRADVGALADAILRAVERHRPLRLTIGIERELLDPTEAAEVVAGFKPLTSEEFISISDEAIARPIDIENGPLVRFSIQPLQGDRTGVVVIAHHGVTDAAGLDRIWADVESLHEGEILPPLDQRYSDHALEIAQRVQQADIDWIGAEQIQPERLNLTPSIDEDKGYLTRAASFTRDQLTRVPGAPPMSICLAGLAVTLKPHQPGRVMTVGLPLSVKGLSDGELAGCWLNVVAAQLNMDDLADHQSILLSCSAVVGEAIGRRMVPQSTVNKHRRRQGLQPIVPEVMLAFSEVPAASLGTFGVSSETMTAPGVRSPLAFFVEVRQNEVSVGVEYDGSLTNSSQAAELLRTFDSAIADLIAGRDPEASPRGSAAREFESLGDLIAAQAHNKPSATAVVSGADVVTYGELIDRADSLAVKLQARGIGPGERVGVMAPRSAGTVVAILAVLRSGAAYVPLDPHYPIDRLAYIAADANLGCVVTGPATGHLADGLGVPIIEAGTDPQGGELEVPSKPTDEAYVIYTSGSTGRPKGVPISQANIVASTMARSTVYQDDPRAFLMVSSFSFDSSLVGLFWTLTTGGMLVIPSDGLHADVVHLSELIAKNAVSHVLAVPSLYRVLLEETPAASLQSVTDVIVAGEPCPIELVIQHQSILDGVRLHNEYGPTEATVWSHHHEFTTRANPNDDVPIGTAIPGVESAVVAADGELCGAGEVGELIIGGFGVSRGYIGLGAETAKRFGRGIGAIKGATYRTGDLVRTNTDGELIFVGRVDRQAKVQGFRIEPELIESELSAIEGVLSAVVDVRSGRLVAWVETRNHEDPEEPIRIRTILATRLPEHEVPRVIVCQAKLPRTVNGKIDHSQLIVPEVFGATSDAAASNPTAVQIGAIWADVLGVPAVGENQNFFDLGGDSIQNIRIIARMRQAGFAVKPRDIFDNPSVSELAAALIESGADEPQAGIDPGPKTDDENLVTTGVDTETLAALGDILGGLDL